MAATAVDPCEDLCLSVGDHVRIRQTRQVLERAGYNRSGVMELLGDDSWTKGLGIERADVPRFSRRCRNGSPLETFVRLFLLGMQVGAEEFRRAVAPTTLDNWAELGLIEAEEAEVLRRLEIFPYEGLLLAHPRRSLGLREPVMKVAPDSHHTWTLAQMTVRRPGGIALDLGSGSGLHSLLAAAHSRLVIGVDCNPHALNLAEFNAQLNGLDSVEFREGSFFEPVAEETFDLIVSNPPYVISPEHVGVYRDSGLPGDLVCQQIVQNLPRFLRPDGYAHVVINWAHITGEDPEERLRSWVAGSGCDAWTLRFNTAEPAEYATLWVPKPEDGDWPAFQRRFNAWMDYYESERIEAISYGLISLHRRPGARNWFACEDAPDLVGPCGPAVEQVFHRRTFLNMLPDDQALLALRVRVAADVSLEQKAEFDEGKWAFTGARMQLAKGLKYGLEADRNVIAFVEHCRGDRPLGAVLTELAEALDTGREEVISAGLELARLLLIQGLLETVPQETA
jgi:methylase of polypeptide subunit release factors